MIRRNEIKKVAGRKKVSYMDPGQVIKDGTVELNFTYRVIKIHTYIHTCIMIDYADDQAE
jgi:hypothetical protein